VSRSRKAIVAACAATLLFAPAAGATGKHHSKKPSPRDRDTQSFVRDVSVREIAHHQKEFQAIARANGGNRNTLGSGGYEESVNYVVDELREDGYRPKVVQFNHPFWRETAPAVLNQVTPTPTVYRYGDADDDGSPNVDFITMMYSPTANLDNARVIPTNDIVIPPPTAGGSTSGCEATDYPAAVRGNVALVMRGTCAFVDKAAMAQSQGAIGVIIFNDGFSDARQNPIFVDDQVDLTIPAVVSSHAVGKALYDAFAAGQNPTVDFQTFGTLQDRFFPQVIAQTRHGDPNNVVMLSAHLDSVIEGPGINDNASGSGTLLQIASELAERGRDLRQAVRFGWWGGEEEGLIGSLYYAENLSQREVDKIDGVLNYDMLASPNFVRMIYDGDGSDGGNPPGPPGSGLIEQLHRDWFDYKGLASRTTPFDGRSDYVGFSNRGIPAGGLFTGAEDEKTAEEEAIYGGAAGAWYDPCYHQACDDLSTVFTGIPPLDAQGLLSEDDETPTEEEALANARKMRGGAMRGLDQMSDAASYTTWYLATAKNPFGSSKAAGAKKKGKKVRKLKARGHREG
jgi:Zn-dependent M28 family amino/carboxypeptidase